MRHKKNFEHHRRQKSEARIQKGVPQVVISEIFSCLYLSDIAVVGGPKPAGKYLSIHLYPVPFIKYFPGEN